MAIEIVKFANGFRKLVAISKTDPDNKEAISEEILKLKSQTSKFFKDYYKPIDEDVMTSMLRLYDQNLSSEFKPEFFQ